MKGTPSPILHKTLENDPFQALFRSKKTPNYPNSLLLSVASNPTCKTENLCNLPKNAPISAPYSLHPSTKTPQLTTLHPCLQEILQGFCPSAQHFRTDVLFRLSNLCHSLRSAIGAAQFLVELVLSENQLSTSTGEFLLMVGRKPAI